MRDLIEFEKLVFSCERLAERDPRGYRLRVFLLATLDFAFIATILLLSAGAGVWLIYNHLGLFKLAIIPLALSWLLLRSLLVTIRPPEGVEITRETAPRLFARIDAARTALSAAPIHRVVVDLDSYNAGVVQIPRFGALGWPRNHLVLGLPFLETVSVEELDFVLGHEFGHLSRKQARFRNWIYRVRQAWPRILDALEGGNRVVGGLFERFLKWYAPYFNAYSFVLARANEYDADRAGAEFAGRGAAARALVATGVFHDFIEKDFWPAFFRGAVEGAEAPSDPVSRSLQAARRMSPAQIECSMRRVFAQKTSLDDTHPSVADRLQALGEAPRSPVVAEISASETLLGDLRDRLLAEADSKWAGVMSDRWERARERRAELEARAAECRDRVETLDENGLFEYAALLEETEGRERVRPLVEAALSRRPDHAPALFMRGRLRLVDGDADGAHDIERAIALDPSAREPGSRILASFFMDRRDIARGLPFIETVREIDRQRSAAEAERSSILPTDDFTPHRLDEAGLDGLRARLRDLSVACVWLVRRNLRLSPDRVHHVAVVAFAGSHRPTDDEWRAILAAMPEQARDVVLVEDQRRSVTRKIAAIEGALVYGKARSAGVAGFARDAFSWARRQAARLAILLAAAAVGVGFAHFREDPRARFAYASLLIHLGRDASAVEQLRDLLARDRHMNHNHSLDLESRIRLTLAELLMAQSRAEEARAAALPTCHWMMPDELRLRRDALGFCERSR
jgi:Zn-dependent protease with chaperone function